MTLLLAAMVAFALLLGVIALLMAWESVGRLADPVRIDYAAAIIVTRVS